MENVVIDLPTSIHTVTDAHLRAWGVDEEQAFTVARQGVQDHEPINVSTFKLTDAPEYTFVTLTGSDYYTSAYALMLDAVFEIDKPGVLVAAPAASLVVAVALDPDRALHQVRLLFQHAQDTYEVASTWIGDPLTPSIFHWREGQVQQVTFPAEPGDPTDYILTPHAMTFGR